MGRGQTTGVQPVGGGLWAGKGSVGLQGPRVEGQEWEGGPCWALGTLGGPCLGDEQAFSCLAQAGPSLPGLPTPAPSQGSPSHPAPPGTVGSNRVQESGLDKGFLQELSLRSPHLELSHTAGARRRARPQAGREVKLRVPPGPLALGSREAEAWRWVPHRVAHSWCSYRGSRQPLKTPHPRVTHLGPGQMGSRPEARWAVLS